MNKDMKKLCEAASHNSILIGDDVEVVVNAILTTLQDISDPMRDAAHPHVGGSIITSGAYDDAFKASIAAVLEGE